MNIPYMYLRKTFFFLFLAISAFAQLEKPTTWTTKIKQDHAAIGDVVEVEFTVFVFV
jgi:hypothetical protein